jgi:hypothetical protein
MTKNSKSDAKSAEKNNGKATDRVDEIAGKLDDLKKGAGEASSKEKADDDNKEGKNGDEEAEAQVEEARAKRERRMPEPIEMEGPEEPDIALDAPEVSIEELVLKVDGPHVKADNVTLEWDGSQLSMEAENTEADFGTIDLKVGGLMAEANLQARLEDLVEVIREGVDKLPN